MLPLQDF
jgi:hypothetical protein